MKILVEGQIPQDKLYTWTCKNCNSKIESKQSEGKIMYDQRDGNYVVFICPYNKCKGVNYIGI